MMAFWASLFGCGSSVATSTTTVTATGSTSYWYVGNMQQVAVFQQQALQQQMYQGLAHHCVGTTSSAGGIASTCTNMYWPVWHDQVGDLAAAHAQNFNAMAQVQAMAQQAPPPAPPPRVNAEATERSRVLLLEHLTPTQRETIEKNGWFVVEGGKSKQKYRIRTQSAAMNIDVIDGDKVKHRLCAHLPSDIPHYDHFLAQKLMLEADEDHFHTVARRHAA